MSVSEYLHNPELGALNDFRNFLYIVWQFLGLPEPTPIQYDIAHYLQHGPRRSIIMAFRGIGKSYITAAFVVWLWLVNPQFKILVVSATEKKATEFASLVKQLITGMPILNHLSPGKGQRDSVLSFDVGPATPAKDPSLNVAGISGQITGGRADFIIPDDVEILSNSATVTQREKLSEKVAEFEPILKTDPWTSVKYLGTPQTEESIYMALASTKGYDIRIWPARYPADAAKYLNRLAPLIQGKLTADPKLVGFPTDTRFTKVLLEERELAMGRGWFQLQYMLDPSLSDEERYPLKLKDLIVMSVNQTMGPVNLAWGADERNMVKDKDFPVVGFNGDRYYRPMFLHADWLPYSFKLMAIDPSGRGQDETAYVVLYFLNGFVYVAEWSGIGGSGYDERNLTKLSEIAKKHGVHEVLVESNYTDGMYNQLLAPVLAKHHKCSLEEVKVAGQKEMRICDTIEPVLGSHRLIVCESVIREDYKTAKQENQAFYQMTRITRERGALKHDDRIDVLALGLARLSERLRVDSNSAEADRMAELKDKLLEEFLQACTGGAPVGEVGEWLNVAEGSFFG